MFYWRRLQKRSTAYVLTIPMEIVRAFDWNPKDPMAIVAIAKDKIIIQKLGEDELLNLIEKQGDNLEIT